MDRLRNIWASRGDWMRGVMFALGFLVIWGGITLPLYLFLPRSDVFKDVSAVLQSFITALAIAAGGYFALFKLQVFRNLQPHLTISHEITHRVVSDSYVHISVTAVLRNSSRVKVELREGFFRLQKIAPTTDEEVADLYAEVFRDESMKNLQWEILDEINRDWDSGELIVEPGESHPETYEFIVSKEVRSVLVYTYFYNTAHSEGAGVAQGWHVTTVYDINNCERSGDTRS